MYFLQLSCSRHSRLNWWGCENEPREMNKTPKSTSHYVCHSHHSLSFYFCKMQNKVKVKMQNQAGGRTCLSVLMKLHSTNPRVGRVFVVKICRLLSSCDPSGKSSENVFPLARVLLCCFRETVHFAPDALLTFCIKSEQDSCPAHTDLEFFRQLSVPHGVRLPWLKDV